MSTVSNFEGVAGKFSQVANQMQRKADGSRSTAGLESAILNALPAHVALIDRDGIIQAVNETWKENSGGLAGADGGIGSSYLEFCARAAGKKSERADLVVAGVRAVLAGEQDTFVLEYPASSESGEHWFRVVVTPFRERDFCGAVVMHADVTGQKTNQALREDDLQAQKMEVVGRLASGVAHDFANLLTLISGYSEILLNQISPIDPLRPELEEIRKAANRGAGMTAHLLDFVRSQAAEPRILDLNALVMDMQKMLRPIIGEHIEFAMRLEPGLGKVKMDPAQMTRVIMNLVLNARDAMPRGGRITVETANIRFDAAQAVQHEVAAGPYVTISLTDTGEGMDAATRAQVFRPFFTTKGKGKGTGLGLSTVYSIVRQCQGDVCVRSEPGKGTAFTICLPRAEEAAVSVESSPDGARRPRPGTETILLVEDEEGVRRLLKHILVARGYKVLEAGNGREALDIYSGYNDPIHLLVTDIVMPRMNGNELACELLKVQPELRVIYISGYTDDMLVRTGALGPGMAFLQKPIKPDVLAGRVREVLDAPARTQASSGE